MGKARRNQPVSRPRRTAAADRVIRTLAAGCTDPAEALELLNDDKACPVALRDFSWAYLVRQSRRGGQTFKAHTGSVEHVAFSPDGLILATASGGPNSFDEVKLWDVAAFGE